MIGRQKVFALCWMSPGTSGRTLRFGADAFRVPSAEINDPSNTAAGAGSVWCSRLVCMECRLSIPPNLSFFSTLIIYIP